MGHNRRPVETYADSRFGVELGTRSMRHPISCWKLSRALRDVESSSQVSLPYSNTGMIQVSKMLLEDRGFKSPWNAPSLPRAKKAFLALLTFSVMECWVDRFEFHYTPRHFEVLEVEIVESPIWITAVSCK